ncbi:MAG: cohesin domain-containing protein [Clostridium sp.]
MKFSQKLKRVAVALSLVMVFQVAFSQLIPTSSASAATTQVNFAAPSTAKVGDVIDIAVNVSNVSGVYGAAVDFKYDPTVLEVQSITKGNAFGSTALQMPVNQVKNGEANIALTMTGNNAGVTVNGTIATIKAKVLKGPATINLNATNSNNDLSLTGNNVRIKLSNNASAPVSYTVTNSKVDIADPNPPNPSDKVTITSLTPDKKSGEPLGSTITFTAQTNDTLNSTFEFWVKEGSTWIKMQTWSAKNTFSYTPKAAGNFTVRVHAKHKNAISSQGSKDLYYFVKNPATMAKITSLTADKVSGQVTAGTPITFTCTTNITANSMFEYWVKEGSTWVKKQAWTSSNKFVYTPSKSGTYTIRVHARHKNYNTSDGYKDITIVVK